MRFSESTAPECGSGSDVDVSGGRGKPMSVGGHQKLPTGGQPSLDRGQHAGWRRPTTTITERRSTGPGVDAVPGSAERQLPAVINDGQRAPGSVSRHRRNPVLCRDTGRRGRCEDRAQCPARAHSASLAGEVLSAPELIHSARWPPVGRTRWPPTDVAGFVHSVAVSQPTSHRRATPAQTRSAATFEKILQAATAVLNGGWPIGPQHQCGCCGGRGQRRHQLPLPPGQERDPDRAPLRLSGPSHRVLQHPTFGIVPRFGS